MLDPAALRARLAGVQERLARAAERSNRPPSSIRLVAVSKTFAADDVRVVAGVGQFDFGENKVQEALTKMGATADLPLRWHLIGHLQSNKAKKAAQCFDVVHSIDRVEIGDLLDRSAAAADRTIQGLVQVDFAGKPTKHGAREEALGTIFEAARRWQRVRVVGLMLLPPAADEPDAARPYFEGLRLLRDRLAGAGVPSAMLTELSMGMSHDFEVAVQEGATLVRVGAAIFGDRPAN